MNRNHVRRGAGRHLTAALVCAAALVAAPAASWADDARMAKDAGMGLGSALASLFYVPVKTFYAVNGVVVGGLAYAFSGGDADVARVVWEPSVLGDYVITTEHLRGERPVEFFGRQQAVEPKDEYARPYDRPRDPRQRDVASAPDTSATDGW